MSEAPRNFVAYHMVDERGPLRSDGDGGGRFETNKSSKPRKGDVLWCIEGEGSPKKYRLAARGVVTRLTMDSNGTSIAHYNSPTGFKRIAVNGLPWFQKLVKEQGWFGFGLNAIKDPESIGELESLVAPKDVSKYLATSEADDVAAIEADPDIPDETTRKALVDARRGQGKYRSQLDERWVHACAVTNCSIRDLLRASHIKPWSISNTRERLDPQNGLLLTANIDILFEKGFVSFADDGRMLVSPRLSASEQRQLGLPKNLKRRPDAGECGYLAHHRRAFKFKKGE